MRIEGKDLEKDYCEKLKVATSKFGMTVVCDEDDEKELTDIILPADENCENIKVVASKAGKVVVCDEEA